MLSSSGMSVDPSKRFRQTQSINPFFSISVAELTEFLFRFCLAIYPSNYSCDNGSNWWAAWLSDEQIVVISTFLW